MNGLLSAGWGTPLVVTAASLAVGSFLNVVAHRLPIMLERRWRADARALLDLNAVAEGEPFNLWRPRSTCPACGEPIPWQRNVPLVSWALLRGRCGECGVPIPLRYPLVEALTAAASLVVVHAWGWQWLTLALLFFSWSLIALAVIDIETHLLPDQITLPLLWGGLLAATVFGQVTPAEAIGGAVAGYLTLWGLYWAFKGLTGKEGMGHGDFKLFAALGAWLGVAALPAVALLASLGGLVYALALIAFKAMRREDPIPFGPFLAGAGWATLLFKEELIALYSLAPLGP